MTEPFRDLPLPAARHLDGVCRRFELSWGDGDTPRLEEYLDGAPGSERTALLSELLALELEYRRKRGEEPQVSDYLTRFSADHELVAHVWESAATAPPSGGGGGPGAAGVAASPPPPAA